MYSSLELLADEERLAPVRGLKHAVAARLKDRACDVTHLIFVFHQQDRLGAAESLVSSDVLFGLRDLIARARQVYSKSRAAPHLARNADAAAALPDDPVDCRKPQPCPPAEFLGCEERLEDVRQHALIHAAARVSRRQH